MVSAGKVTNKNRKQQESGRIFNPAGATRNIFSGRKNNALARNKKILTGTVIAQPRMKKSKPRAKKSKPRRNKSRQAFSASTLYGAKRRQTAVLPKALIHIFEVKTAARKGKKDKTMLKIPVSMQDYHTFLLIVISSSSN